MTRDDRVRLFVLFYLGAAATSVLWPREAERFREKGATFDAWTAVHAMSGIVARSMGVPLGEFLALKVGHDAFEYAARQISPGSFSGDPETLKNMAADWSAHALGWIATDRVIEDVKED